MPRDVFIQAFKAGDPVFLRHGAVEALARPYVLATREGVATVIMEDGGAEIWGYGEDGGLAVVGATGAEIWELVVAIARATGAAMIPVGGAPVVADEAVIAQLPGETRAAATVVGSGADLLAILTAAGPWTPPAGA